MNMIAPCTNQHSNELLRLIESNQQILAGQLGAPASSGPIPASTDPQSCRRPRAGPRFSKRPQKYAYQN
jgi:hypothetical protein